ncbi:UDP-N-acetylglucosamine 2-epimerase (non-hydrolysing) [Humibacillus xanthopallidus]|uniref:UDP-N-acetylglucosamine 2-epimerase (Non-hydrolysing) n=1 Tax=Humibacillus xanthopallidus TaxID=412689 RepID=A0A543PX85_9MICO|nr:UDP-N-acetylglucosamine 2-epimerase [Humibacillus xanthopallidus]TQN48676.1 UDP-N-acetylglucosamine 2-epimerase (non-hydrolysing) [Humibacillus xanthopallidus]
MTTPLTVAVFVGTRADLGPLLPVIEALAGDADVRLRILTGVMYAADDLAQALPPSGSVPSWHERIVALADPMTEVTVGAQLEQGAVIARGAGRALRDESVDVLVVLGDRWELLYVVPPAVLLGVPIVHLHGGEVTEGALDERVRHAVTKLADQHCVASEDAAARLRQLGEAPERIHVTGAPGLDRLAAAAPADDEALARLLQVASVRRPLALFTYHPPTAQQGAPVGQWAREAAEAALAVCGTVLATHPGMDEGRDEVLAALTSLAATEPRLHLVPALGRDYPAVLAAADVVVGNSSSGVIEAATVHVPAVDVGERQRGRLRGDNVVHADEGRPAVEAALRTALSAGWRDRTAAASNPYGTGGASQRILDIVRAASGGTRAKHFVDLPRDSGRGGGERDREEEP